MVALVQRNIKIYFSNRAGVVMSCLGALISFVIFIGFLQSNLEANWKLISNIKELLDLWMTAGIVSIAGITTSFQALGQLVKDRESRTIDDLSLTDVSVVKQNLAYVLSGTLISFMMQVITLLVMMGYFKLVDRILIPTGVIWPSLGYMGLGSLVATLLNLIIILFIHSSTTFSRLSSIIGAIAGFDVATYLPYGALTSHTQALVKLVPSSYEAAALRSLLLNQVSQHDLSAKLRYQMIDYLGIYFKINGYQLKRIDDLYIMLGMMLILIIIIVIMSWLFNRRRSV
ncbi:ABC transporter permease [Limosilactobacillus equigenerosi]|uniref:Abc-type multidrug transport system, permease component n=1 Tax=Limosilactobacillus equigenerosi DSM 18793 = JCM 14505 TaxID=1423742 RepID=A0A0R1UPA6_9LACO|nr:ABC transporter permease [Limosilactobacillus equigenerosi]KRL95005.1 abc-type multidrug transport system, permease component [Limosilactobacillus equigenerosi DSM 18793 = JCM 14505]